MSVIVSPLDSCVGDVPMLVGGEHLAAAAGGIDVDAPCDGTTTGRIPRGGVGEVAAAVAAARKAFPAWRDARPVERGDVIRRIADALEPLQERLARLSAC